MRHATLLLLIFALLGAGCPTGDDDDAHGHDDDAHDDDDSAS